jgi:glycosyltransferase involved in cell wall biosynthesis
MLESVAAFVDRGDAVVVSLPVDGPLGARVRSLGARVEVCPAPVLRKDALRPLGAVRLLATAARSVRPALRTIRSVRPDAIYVSTLTIPMWFLLAGVLRIPALCHVHEAETGASRLAQRVLAAPLLSCRVIVANSEFSERVLTRAIPRLRDRCRVVTNPVPGPAAPQPPRETLDGSLRVLFIGRLSPRKGPQIAVEAVATLAGRGLDVHLDLLGAVFEGYEWFERELRQLVSDRQLDARVQFLGFRADVWPALAATDVVVVPSLADEPFGNTAVEAILAARPLIASGAGGLVEATRGYTSAQTVPPGDSDALAAAMETVVSTWSELREATASDARTAADRHSVATYSDAIRVALEDAVEGPRTVR